MLPHTRAIVAAAAYAFIFRKKVGGVHDYSAGTNLRIAAEARGSRLQAYDGDRGAHFGGDLPEFYDSGDDAFVSLAIDRATAQGYDRGSAGHYSLNASEGLIQLYDHAQAAWFAFSIRTD